MRGTERRRYHRPDSTAPTIEGPTTTRPADGERRIAIVGSGIAGLACAHLLAERDDVTLFEADHRPGGHANTVVVDDPDAGPLAVDTGFIVHNDRNYPELVRLFDELAVPTLPSEMSFGVDDRASGFAYRATSPATLLARPRNAVDPRLWRMLIDIARFFRHGRRFLSDPDPDLTIGAFLDRGHYGDTFVDLHLLPMGAAVWSTGPEGFRDFPALSLLRFLDNHGLLGVGDRPEWRTVAGGSITYVRAIVDRLGDRVRTGCPVREVARIPGGGVTVVSAQGRERFDAAILACHSDQASQLLADPTPEEDRVLRAIRYRPNEAVLHTDVSFLPRHRRAWAAWNYHAGPDRDGGDRPTLTYDLTTLQRLPGRHRYLVTVNPDRQPRNELARFDYAHPQFDHEAIASQQCWEAIDGVGDVHFCGAYWGYGFHEDGLVSALRVCRRLGVAW